jgi:hypothetical protein
MMTQIQARRILWLKRLVERVTNVTGNLTGISCLFSIALLTLSLFLVFLALVIPSEGSFAYLISSVSWGCTVGMFIAGGILFACIFIDTLVDGVFFIIAPYQGQKLVGKRISQRKAWHLLQAPLPEGVIILGYTLREVADGKQVIDYYPITSPSTWASLPKRHKKTLTITTKMRFFLVIPI